MRTLGLVTEARHSKTNVAGLYLHEVPKIAKFTESGRGMVAAGAGGGDRVAVSGHKVPGGRGGGR